MSRFNALNHRLTATDLDIDKRRTRGRGDMDYAGTHHQESPKYPGMYATTSKQQAGAMVPVLSVLFTETIGRALLFEKAASVKQ